ncbi:MAG: class I SAM-dependent methyltransferase [Candidatus Sumerlaeia bacterium]|nr:class I SAM-dependent methyltransferase [Candidatus Sumerlaeia bacterium]
MIATNGARTISFLRDTIRRWRDPWERAYGRLPVDQRTREDVILDEPAIARELKKTDIPTRNIDIDVGRFREWRREADYEGRHEGYYTDNLDEKSLEHFLAADLANLQSGQVVIDVASQTGIAGEIYERLYGVEVYRQDLEYPAGMNDRLIGGDAADMPVPDNFADVLTLHCSFEHFEGPSDTGFIREAGRVLKPGGTCIIAPLYLAQYYIGLTHPPMADGVPFEPRMRIHALRHWKNRFGRMYSVDKFIERVWNHRGDLEGEILLVDNFRDVADSVYLRYILVLKKTG